MINANELRIGNLVNIHGHKGVSKVHTVGIATQSNYVRVNYVDDENNDRISNGYSDEIVHAIPLTEEILLKCGFVADTSNGSFDTFENGLKFTIIDKCESWIIYLSGPFGMVVLKHIATLHQLQNLYFALTGKELVYSV